MKPRVSHQKTAALTLVEVLVVIAVLFILAVLLMPSLAPRPRHWWRPQCVNNLKQVGLSYFVWAGDHNGKFPMQVSMTNGGTMELTADGKNPWLNFLAMSNELSTPINLWCPADKDDVLATNWTSGFSAKNVSYFVGLDADKAHPQMFLSGDDNFAIGGVPVKPGLLEFSTNAPIAWTAERHVKTGNIGFADGSVMYTSPSGLLRMLVQTGVATNRLAIP
jgi:prepilin-type processing-associated H-X9-DG protein